VAGRLRHCLIPHSSGGNAWGRIGRGNEDFLARCFVSVLSRLALCRFAHLRLMLLMSIAQNKRFFLKFLFAPAHGTPFA